MSKNRKKKTWEKRVTKFDTWFDHRRLKTLGEFKGKDFPEILSMYEKALRKHAIISAYISWHFTQTQEQLTIKQLMRRDENVLNDKLPIPLPQAAYLIDAVYQIVDDQKDFIRHVMSHRYIINDVLDREMRSKMYIFDLVDAATCALHPTLLSSNDTELMVMEADLADKVLASDNEPITAEDLVHVPFEKCFLEFNRPVTIIERGKHHVKAIAVGFYKNTQRHCYSVIWFREKAKHPYKDETFGLGTQLVDSMLSVTFAPESNLSRIIIDDPSRVELGFPHLGRLNYVGGNIFGASDEVMLEFNTVFREVQDILMEKTRNIWDFVTSRNIDYETYQRGGKHLNKLRTFQHLQGERFLGPRVFKILKVNKHIRKPEESTGVKQAVALGYREHVPAKFHKWVYCRACDRVHRHDLIGKSCRRCQQLVGPIANIVIKKWWHEDYWRGEGPIKNVIREIKE